jgi:Flp pilus assembly pilin Flp
MAARPRLNCTEGVNVTVSEFLKREDGQTMAEYGVVLAVITLGVVLTLGLLSGGITSALSSVISYL